VAVGDFLTRGSPPAPPPAIPTGAPPHAARAVATILRTVRCGLSSRVVPSRELFDLFHAPLRPFGIVDVLGINACATRDSGVFVGAYLRRSRPLTPGQERVYGRIARHLAAAYRLRNRIGRPPPSQAAAAAILLPNGRLEHATRDAAGARAALRTAVLAMDRARGAERRIDPDSAVGRWRVLVDTRFSLIDRFEADGRRYVVACENEPGAERVAALTERESQVVGLYRLGADAKLIAYELGIAAATVRVLLCRGARKLGVGVPRALRSPQ
jgi:hypothetical protein